MENYIVGLGETLFDCLPDGKKLGGAPANFAYHVSQFGLNGMALSAIGNDEDGKQIIRELNAHGLKHHLEVVDQPTGTVQVTLSGDGIPQYDICLGVAYDNLPWTPEIERIAHNTRAVCFGTLAQRTVTTRSTIYRFLDAMPPLGTFKLFDINLRQNWYSKEVIEESLSRCNVLKINDEEFGLVTRLAGLKLEGVETAARALMKRYAISTLVLTCGEEGSYVFADDGTANHEKTPRVCVADTVGAGDSFTAAFVSGMLGGMDIAAAHKLAVDVSAFVCTQHGAMPELPAELVERFKAANG